MADLAEVYDKHRDDLVRFAASQVGWSNAEDVTASAVVGALVRRGAPIDDLRAYLYRCVANASAKHWRSRDRRTRREQAFALPASRCEVGPDGTSVTDIDIALTSALGELSVQQRAMVHLTYWEDCTPSMVADRLGVSDGSVRRQLARARARLREHLDER